MARGMLFSSRFVPCGEELGRRRDRRRATGIELFE